MCREGSQTTKKLNKKFYMKVIFKQIIVFVPHVLGQLLSPFPFEWLFLSTCLSLFSFKENHRNRTMLLELLRSHFILTTIQIAINDGLDVRRAMKNKDLKWKIILYGSLSLLLETDHQ